MITFKKTYAEQMLQLALALSLLQVDPETYLGRGWESQFDIRNGDAWELEMLRAVPMAQYPYANRKAMIPLIEDLIRFDRQATNFLDITAYLLNVQNGQANETASIPGQNYTSTQATTTNPPTAGSSVNLESPISPSPGNDLDIFLNSDHFQNQIPLIEQNLADLREYDDLLPSSIYANLPLKDEPLDLNVPLDVKFEPSSEADSALGSDTDFRNSMSRTNDSFDELISWANLQDFFKEDDEDEIEIEIHKTNDEKKKTAVNKDYSDDDEKCDEGISEIKIKNENIDNMNKAEGSCGSGNEDIDSSIQKEESEIVEVLWKQDVDLGYSPPKPGTDSTSSKVIDEDEEEKLKALENLKNDKELLIEDVTKKSDDEWDGVPFTIDNETGEYIWQSNVLQLDEILQDVLELADLNKEDDKEEKKLQTSSSPILENLEDNSDRKSTVNTETVVKGFEEIVDEIELPSSLPSPLLDFEDANELEEEFDKMIQSAGPFHQPHRTGGIGQNYGSANSAFRQSGFHHHHHQARVPLSRGVSMEQRLQDIASLFNPIPSMGVADMTPYSHYPNPYYHQGATMHQHGHFPQHPVLHNASLAELGGAPQPHYGHNLGSAVSSSMHLTNSSHENDSGATAYKMEHDMMYYSNTSSEMNHTTDGFINSILNDEDLQLMDMGVNESFCSMRMIDSNATSNNSSVLGGNSTSAHLQHAMATHHHLKSGLGINSTDTNNGIVGSTMGNDGIGASVGGTDRLDASSDSAVSSMGSERVPSLSDGEWGEGSDSAQDYHHGKYSGVGTGAHDYSYNRMVDNSRQQAPVAQKKHQMYGKRYFQEPQNNNNVAANSNLEMPSATAASPAISGTIKYEYDPYVGLHHHHHHSGLDGPIGLSKEDFKYGHWSLDFGNHPQTLRTPRTPHDLISHNHTYTLPQGSGSVPRPQTRDKKLSKRLAAAHAAATAAEDEHLTRDEKRARALNIPITVADIINLPMDEFNERLSKYDLTENQLSLIRDIRRRGKNKVAAQNCRKRKLDQIISLEDEVRKVRRQKEEYYSEREILKGEKNRIANKFSILHRHVFQYLRDPDGNLCSPTEYSLQQAADGSVYLLRRDTNKPVESNHGQNSNSISTDNNPTNQSGISYDPSQHYHNPTTTQQHRPSTSSHHQNHLQKE